MLQSPPRAVLQSPAHWAAYVKAIVGKKAHEWDARKNGHYAVLARREDPQSMV